MDEELKIMYNYILNKLLMKKIKNKIGFFVFMRNMFIIALPMSMILCVLLFFLAIIEYKYKFNLLECNETIFFFTMICIIFSPVFIVLYIEKKRFKDMYKNGDLKYLNLIIEDRYQIISLNNHDDYFEQIIKIMADNETIEKIKKLAEDKIGKEKIKTITEDEFFTDLLKSQNGISYYYLLNFIDKVNEKLENIKTEEKKNKINQIWN